MSDDPFESIVLAATELLGNDDLGPRWWSPNDAQMDIAAQFARQHDIDLALALRLTKERFNDFRTQYPDIYQQELSGAGFHRWMQWYRPTKQLLRTPEATCPGMNAAGRSLAQSVLDGERIAVYCDYDPDGTTAGEAFRQALLPYVGQPCGCGHAGGVPGPDGSCERCGDLGFTGGDDRLHYGYADAQSGFGLTTAFVEEAHAAGASTLVTLDCGSTQTEQVALAQSLGMRVIVVDHHGLAEGDSAQTPVNPAEHHLNPLLHAVDGVPPSANTGAQLAWKLGVATQGAMEGRPRPEYARRAMYLAGFGCRADMGDVGLHEHRAFFHYGIDHGATPPPGMRALASALDEDASDWSSGILTQAVMNLPKRTTRVDASDVGQLLAAPSEKAAAPIVERLLNVYEEAKPVRKEMVALAKEQAEGQDGRFAHAVLDVDRRYAGYTGPVANSVAAQTGKPALIFAYREQPDPQEPEVLKWSVRPTSGQVYPVGDLRDQSTPYGQALAAASTVRKRDESGEWVERPSYGGHEQVLSGACTPDKIQDVVDAFEEWAQSKKKTWDRPKPNRPYDAYPSERRVHPDRLAALERAAKRLAPYGMSDQPGTDGKRRRMFIAPLTVSVVGKVADWQPDPDDEDRYRLGTLTLENGERRQVRAKVDFAAGAPKRKGEWILEVGGSGAYFVRHAYAPRKGPTSTPADREELLAHHRLLEYGHDPALMRKRDRELRGAVFPGEEQ